MKRGSRAVLGNPDRRAAAELFEGASVRILDRRYRPDEYEVEFLSDGPHWRKGERGWILARYVLQPFRPSRTQLDVLRLVAEGRELGDYVPSYRVAARRGRGAFPVTIAARAASQLQKAGLLARDERGRLYVTDAGRKLL